MPYPLPLTRTEAYLAYKAGVIQQSDLKPSLAIPRNGIDAWLAYWTGLAADYPKREDGTPHILQEEEAYIAYLCGVINEYPEKCLRRVGAYLRYLISARWGRPDHPLNREELYLSLIKTQFIPSGDPSSDIVIDGTTKAPFVDVKLYGDTFQKSYTGKNILSIAFRALAQGIRTTQNPDGTLTLHGTCTALYSNISNRQPLSLTAGTYTLSTTTTHPKFGVMLRLYEEESGGTYFAEYGVSKNGSSITFTLGSDAKSGYIWLAGTSEGLEIDETIGIQLEVGSTATSFEPYVGGQPSPSPDYPQAIQTVTGEQTISINGTEYSLNLGKNLLSMADETTTSGSAVSTVSNNNHFEISGTVSESWGFQLVASRKQIAPIQPGTYTLSITNPLPYSTRVQFRNTSSGSSLVGNLDIPSGTTSITFELSETANYITWWSTASVGTTVTASFDAMIEAGSQATAYAPYFEPIELCKLGTYQDYIWKDGEDWKVHKATANITLNNTADTSNWSKSNSTANNVYINQNIPNLVKDSPIVATNLTTYPTADIYSRDIVGICYNTTGAGLASIRIGVGLSGASTINLFKSWLESNPVTAYYALATPTDNIITNQTLVDQLEALVNGGSEEGTTYIKVSATDPNLPGLLYVEAAKYV